MGTRSLNPNVPKILQNIAGNSLLSWHKHLLINNGISGATVVAAHLSEAVDAACIELTDEEFTFGIAIEDSPSGTFPAVLHASKLLESERYLVLLGDILMSFDILRFLQAWESSKLGVAVIVHPNLHPNDSDATYVDSLGTTIVSTKIERNPNTRNISSAGVFGVTDLALRKYSGILDLGSDLLKAACEQKDLFIWNSSHYLKDTGTPVRLFASETDIKHGAFQRRGKTLPRPAIFLDRDGVINPNYGDVPPIESYELMPGIGESISTANKLGIPIFIVTNQPGLAKGFFTESEHEQIIVKMENLLLKCEAYVDEYVFCPHHPEKGYENEVVRLKVKCECRKPNGMMVKEISNRHLIDIESSVMVGDMKSDRDFADNLGMKFVHVSLDCEFESNQDHFCFASSGDAVNFGIDLIK